MIKICCLHPKVSDVPSFLKNAGLEDCQGLTDTLVWDTSSPDVLFASELIYYKYRFASDFRRLYSRSGIKVAYLCEALEGDMNLFDYVIGFSNQYPDNSRFIRLPAPADMFKGFLSAKENSLNPDEAAALLETKTGFCNFLYSNGKAHPRRDELFHLLSSYKRVDSLGKHLCNMPQAGTGYGNGHAKDCVGIKSPYKFSIAAENAVFRGYTTEKVLTSLEAHTVPVYWGNPDVIEDINPKAIVNVSSYDSDAELLEAVKEIDADDGLWAKMVSEPWQTPEQADNSRRRTENYRNALTGILSGNASRQAPEGFHEDLYRRGYFSVFNLFK